MKKIAIGIVILVTVLCILLSSIKLYFLRTAADGTLIWNSREAYLFVDVGTRGYVVSYLTYPFEIIKEYFGDIPLPRDTRFSIVVLRIAPQLEQWELANRSLTLYTPIQGVIYANQKGSLWKWSGTYFQPATEMEQRELQGIKHLSGLPMNGVGGWFKQTSILSRSDANVTFHMEVNGNSETLFVKRSLGGGKASVILLHPDGHSQEVWSVDQTPRRVSRSEYERSLAAH